MKRISHREIELFVAGAVALMGMHALIWMPRWFVAPLHPGSIAGWIVNVLAFPIGIGMLMGRPRAAVFAQIFLCLQLISGCLAVPIFWHFVPTEARGMTWSSVRDVMVAGVLLGLMYWSRAHSHSNEPNAEQFDGANSR